MDSGELLPMHSHPFDVISPPTLPELEPLATPLSNGERDQLNQIEKSIQDHLSGFIEIGKILVAEGLEGEVHSFAFVGRKLRAIRDLQLYRGHKTFMGYLRYRWITLYNAFGKAQAYRLIRAADVMADLLSGESGDWESLPVNEAQMRPLTNSKLTPDQRRAAWKEVMNKGKGVVTARLVQEAVDKQLGPAPPPQVVQTTFTEEPVSAAGTRHDERGDDHEYEALRNVASYKPDVKPDHAFGYCIEVCWDQDHSVLRFTFIRPAIPSRRLKEKRTRNLTISGRCLEDLGFILPGS